MDANKDEIITAMGVWVLVIGAAAGAYRMLAMCVVALIIIAISYRDRLRLSSILAMGVVAFAGAYTMSS